MADTRLIERWLPIAALGIESMRGRMPMTSFPTPNRLHVWWVRRPLGSRTPWAVETFGSACQFAA